MGLWEVPFAPRSQLHARYQTMTQVLRFPRLVRPGPCTSVKDDGPGFFTTNESILRVCVRRADDRIPGNATVTLHHVHAGHFCPLPNDDDDYYYPFHFISRSILYTIIIIII